MNAEKQKTLLLVEDEAIIAMSEKLTLERYGYAVIITNSGEAAVAAVEKTPGIDLILMDINLGAGMDGTEAAAIILKNRDLPVVFLSSHTEPEVVAKTEKITSYGYVVKDSNSAVLDASIKMAFKLFDAKMKELEKEKALRESEASYRVLFSGASDGILLADSQSRQFRYANPAICRMLGYTEKELLRIGVADIHPRGSMDHVLSEFKALEKGEIKSSPDLPCLRKDGTMFYADISHSAVVLEGREYHIGFFHDITERKRAEEVVFQSKKDWEECFDSITDMITIHDNDYNIIRANKAGKALLKLPALEEHLKFKCFSFYHGADAPPAGCPSCDCLRSGMPAAFELFEPYLNRYLEIRALPRFDSNNRQSGLIHIVRDITERQRAIDALKESELRLKAQYQGLPVPTVTWQKKGEDFELIDFNDAAKIITHEKTSEFVGRKASDLYAGRQDILRDLEQCSVEGKVIRKETLSEHFIPGKPIALTIVPIPPDLVMVHMEDISELRRAEEEKEKIISLQRATIESTADGILVIDQEGKITDFNQRFARMWSIPDSILATRDDAQALGFVLDQLLDPQGFLAKITELYSAPEQESFDLFQLKDGRYFERYSRPQLIPGRPLGRVWSFRDISERRQAQEALRESEERFRTLYENSTLGLYRTTPDGRIHLANPALVRMLGYLSFAELTDRELNKTGFEPSYPRAEFVAKIEKHGEVQGLESVWKRKDGGKIIVRESARAIRDAQGKILYYDGIVEDITEIKRSEKLTAALYGISQAMFTAGDLDDLYPRIHGLIAGIVPAGNFFIALLTDDGRTLKFPYYRDEKDASDTEVIRADDPQSLTAEVLRTKKTLLLDDAQLRDRYATGRNRVWGTAPKCWLGVPLRIGSEAIGVMVIQDYRDGRAYSQRDVTLLESTAGQVAIAIARKRTEKALRESVEDFRGYFNMGTVAVCVTSLEKGWIEVNDYMCRMMGYTRDELLRLTWAEMTHPDDLNADVALFNQVLAGQRDSYELEKRFIRKDGQTIHTFLYATCQRNPDGSVHHFLVSLVDISERKKAEILEQAVYEIARAADKAESLDDLYRSVHRIIQTLMPATNFLIARYDEKENLVSFPYFVDEKDPMPKSRKSGRGLTDYVLRTGKTLLSDAAVEKELERRGEAKRRGSHSACWLGVPLKFGDKTIGVIALDNYSDPKAYGEREKKILEYVSGQIANAIARKQAEVEIKRQLAEKEILLKEVHHRIKNNIAAIGGLLSMRLQSITNPEAVAVLKETIGRVDSMRILYDKLLLSEGFEDISVKNYIASLTNDILAMFPDSSRIVVEKRIADFHLDAKRLFPLGLIINELITNKMKYSFINRDAGLIKISLANDAGHVTLIIQDNGVPLPEGFDIEQSKGFGLTLVKMLSQQLGGNFSIEKQQGTCSRVEFNV